MAVAALDWSWETFLEPLSFNGRTCGSSRNVKPFYEYDETPSLVKRFANELKMQDDQKTEERKKDIDSAEQTLMSMWKCRKCGEYSFVLKDLKINWEHYQRALNSKSDRDISGSVWTIKMLQKYVGYEDIVFLQLPSLRDFSFLRLAELNDIVAGNVAQSLSALCGKRESGIDENLTLFHDSHDRTEADSRIILDAILQPLCTAYELTLRCEQSINCSFLPNNRIDYIMYYGNQPIGVVEAKRQDNVRHQSVAQLIVQLLLLASEDPTFFRFGILSDANLFIFAGVSKQRVVFFQESVHTIQLRKLESTEHLRLRTEEIASLIDLALISRKTKRSIEGYLRPSFDGYSVVDSSYFSYFSLSHEEDDDELYS